MSLKSVGSWFDSKAAHQSRLEARTPARVRASTFRTAPLGRVRIVTLVAIPSGLHEGFARRCPCNIACADPGMALVCAPAPDPRSLRMNMRLAADRPHASFRDLLDRRYPCLRQPLRRAAPALDVWPWLRSSTFASRRRRPSTFVRADRLSEPPSFNRQESGSPPGKSFPHPQQPIRGPHAARQPASGRARLVTP